MGFKRIDERVVFVYQQIVCIAGRFTERIRWVCVTNEPGPDACAGPAQGNWLCLFGQNGA